MSSITFDDSRPLALDSAELEVGEIHLEDDRFLTLQVSGHIDLSVDTLSEVLPAREHGSPLARLILVVSCEETRMRSAVEVTAMPRAGRHDFLVTLGRDSIDGRVGLTPWLLRTAPGATAGFSRDVGGRLASGRGVGIHPYVGEPRTGDYLPTEYRNFSEDPGLRHDAHRLHFLDLSGDTPHLLINSDHSGVVDVLEAKGQAGAKPRLREVFFDTISQSVWSQLFLHAVAGLDDDGEARHPWQRGVLNELLPHAFPKRSPAARIEELLAIRGGPNAIAVLAELADKVVQKRVDLPTHMLRLAKETVGTEGT